MAVLAALAIAIALGGCSGTSGETSSSAEPEPTPAEQMTSGLEELLSNASYQSATLDLQGTLSIDSSVIAPSASSSSAAAPASEEAEDVEVYDESADDEEAYDEETYEEDLEDGEEGLDGSGSGSDVVSILAKCDRSGEKTRTQTELDALGQSGELYTNGDSAVLVFGEQAVGGTLAQLEMQQYIDIDSILQAFGCDLAKNMDAVTDAESSAEGEENVYKLVCDPERYLQSNASAEAFSKLGSNGKLDKVELTYRLGADGRLSGIDADVSGKGFAMKLTAKLTKYDETVVEDAPEPTMTYDEMVHGKSDVEDEGEEDYAYEDYEDYEDSGDYEEE